VPVGDKPRHAVLWYGTGVPTDFGAPNGKDAEAFDVNGAGWLAGYYTTSAGLLHAFRHDASNGVLTSASDIGTLGGSFAEAFGIDANGDVVGTSSNASGARHAFLDVGSTMIDLTPSTSGSAFDVAVVGSTIEAVGNAFVSGSTHAFLWQKSPSGVTSVDLGAPSGGSRYAYGIDTAGDIVGTEKTSSGTTSGLLWPVAGSMTNLNTVVSPSCGCTITDARGVGGSSIAATARFGSQSHAALLTANP
jgi:probable HAF family extracellular repeat protein